MSKRTIGTCGNCGGAVTVPTVFLSVNPPPPRCESCGATPEPAHGPVLPMGKPKKTTPPPTPKPYEVHSVKPTDDASEPIRGARK